MKCCNCPLSKTNFNIEHGLKITLPDANNPVRGKDVIEFLNMLLWLGLGRERNPYH